MFLLGMNFCDLDPSISPIIIGGSGYIGSFLQKLFSSKGLRPIILGRSSSCDFYYDFSQPESIPSALWFDRVVLHLATSVVPSPLNSSSLTSAQIEIESFYKLLFQVSQFGCRRFVFLSSGGCVYGPSSCDLIHESHPTLPINPYGYLKLSCESLLHLFGSQYGLEFLIFRPSNCYGPNQFPRHGQGVIASFMQAVLLNSTITLYGDGSVERDYINVQDLANAILLSLDADFGDSRVFNVSSGCTYSLNFIIDQLQLFHDSPLNIKRLPARTFDAPRIGLDSSSLMSHLSWSPSIDFPIGLRQQWDSYSL